MIVQSGPSAAIVFARRPDESMLAVCRDAVVADDPLGLFLAAVTSAGLRSAPDFLFACADGDDLRVLVRGAIDATVVADGDDVTVQPALGVSTWAEHLVRNATDLVVRSNEVEHRLVLAGSSDAPAPVATSGAATSPAPSSPAAAPAIAPTPSAEETIVGFAEPPEAAAEPESEPEIAAEPKSDSEVAAEQPEPAPALDVEDATDLDDDLGNLFETRFRGVEAAAVRTAETGSSLIAGVPGSSVPSASPVAAAIAPPPAPAPATPAAGRLGEHDGLTVTGASLAELRQSLSPALAPGAHGPQNSTTVQAVLCPSRHPNPPTASVCQTCGSPVVDRTIHAVPRPVVGRLRFDSGLVVSVDRRQLLGRKPSADPNGPVDDLPGLVPLPDPETLLSRNHAEIRVAGWDLSVVDLRSQNGTFVVTGPGAEPIRLRPHEPYPLRSGMRVLFADVAACTYEAGSA